MEYADERLPAGVEGPRTPSTPVANDRHPLTTWITNLDEGIRRLGYGGLLLLALALPFELTQRPVIRTGVVTVTNLKLILYAVIALALAGVALDVVRSRPGSFHRLFPSPSARTDVSRTAGASIILAALLGACVISSALSSHSMAGLKWTLDLLWGVLLWLAIPLWMGDDSRRKARHIGAAVVVGATLAGVVGLLEIALGTRFAESLLWFKEKPTTAGPYLRLSGTFAYANIAALYFELALPFAVVGLAVARRQRERVSLLWAAAIVVLLAALLLTYSRGAILGLTAGAIAMGLAARRHRPTHILVRHWRWTAGMAAALVTLVGSIAVASPNPAVLRLTTQSDQDWYRAAYVGTLPANLGTGRQVTVRISVWNPGPLVWRSTGSYRVDLGYHWLYPAGRVAVFEGIRSRLRADLFPGHRQTVLARVRAPLTPGRYLLVWDMIQEGVSWFSLKSGHYTGAPVRVTGPARTAGLPARHARAPRELPTTQSEPDRGTLWAAAMRMIRAHPLFGVGPDGYRLSYGAFTRPPQRHWDTRIFANSLPLEVLADLGLVGGALFLGFIGAIAWPFLRGTWRGHPWTLEEIALVGAGAAFLGHGFVDYMLGSHAIFILFWILCGLSTLRYGPRDLRKEG